MKTDKAPGSPATLSKLWHGTVAFGFRLLYNELAWLYDPVSWLTSFGLWRRWQGTVHRYLPPEGRLLEVACGPGHLLAELAQAEYQVMGLDLSQAMVRQAQHRITGQGFANPVCRGRVQALPFGNESFAAIIATFPTTYIYDPDCLCEMARTLDRNGRLIVVESATLHHHNLTSRWLEWLYRITGQRGPGPDLPTLLEAEGLQARHEAIAVEESTAHLVIAEKD
ncbi:MAG: class I SAM-dependent methyltransferase [Anaerolineae bacterium]